MGSTRRKTIAFLLNDLSSAYQARFRSSIERAARRRDLNLIVTVGRELNHQDEQDRVQNVLYTDWLRPEAIDGVIVLSAALSNYCGKDGLRDLCQRLAPIPTCSIGLAIPGTPSFVVDNRGGMRLAVEHLLRVHQRTRIAYISGPHDNDEARSRLEGYRDALRAAGLPFDEDRVAYGAFTAQTGEEAMREILQRTEEVDAVVGANDYMAMGAMDVLRRRGQQISEDVLVVGFDDSQVARFAMRSLTSVAQPTDLLSDLALGSLLRVMNGEPVAELTVSDVNLVLRESCGCGYVVRSGSILPQAPDAAGRASHFLAEEREDLHRQMQPGVGSSQELWPRWATELLDALQAELDGEVGTFLRLVDRLTEEAALEMVPMDEIALAISQLRKAFQGAGHRVDARVDLERLWMKALAILSAATTRVEGRTALNLMTRATGLRLAGQKLSVALDAWSLASSLEQSLPDLGIDTALVSLTEAEHSATFLPVFALRDGKVLALEPARYPRAQLLPSELLDTTKPWGLIALALTFETTVLGLIVFDIEADAFACEALRSQVAASLMMRSLHERIVYETAARERLAREHLQSEMAIARRIQTALAPKDLRVPQLEIAAQMFPADEVGGDYYDVIATEQGCWLGIGDVSGHGLLSGLVMLMIQSMVSSLVRAQPLATPAEIVLSLNAALVPNIRDRLEQDEYATFMLLKHLGGGKFRFAGAHEDLLVYRALRQECEIVLSSGVWIGINSDISEATVDQELELLPGDLLILHTDGITESQNARFEQFGLARVAQVVEKCAARPVAEILERIVNAAREWSSYQRDDMTCVVIRYQP